MKLIDTLNWRYAAKRMTGEKVPAEKINAILEAVRLSPSSIGLQPYNVIVIENPDIKNQLLPAAFNQPQITEASHLLVFAAWENVTEKEVNEFVNHVAETRNVTVESLAGLKTNLQKIPGRTQEVNFNWAARQAYIALGIAIAAAAEEKVDATPMEGFNPETVDEILQLKEKGLKSLSILALGYRDTSTDWLAGLKKVRWNKEKLFINYN